MKVRRNLSGIYFRSKNQETGRMGNFVFEDLDDLEQDKILSSLTDESLKSMIRKLSNTINEIAELADISRPRKHLSNYQCFWLSCYLSHTQPKHKILHD